MNPPPVFLPHCFITNKVAAIRPQSLPTPADTLTAPSLSSLPTLTEKDTSTLCTPSLHFPTSSCSHIFPTISQTINASLTQAPSKLLLKKPTLNHRNLWRSGLSLNTPPGVCSRKKKEVYVHLKRLFNQIRLACEGVTLPVWFHSWPKEKDKLLKEVCRNWLGIRAPLPLLPHRSNKNPRAEHQK